MELKQVIKYLEDWAPLYLQEGYDNSGLITGDANCACTGIICSLDATENVVEEAIQKNCNLIVAHHPVIFRPIKTLTNTGYVERTLLKAIKNDIAIYAIHTNLDNITGGVNSAIARKLGLVEKTTAVLNSKKELLSKLYTYVPVAHADKVKTALFQVGAGSIGLYEECSFSTVGSGTFKPLAGSDPFIGTAGGLREEVQEVKIELIFPSARQNQVIRALLESHPYEEVAYEVIKLENADQYSGSGLIGELPSAVSETTFLQAVKQSFNLHLIKHTSLLNKPLKKIALCGGAGSFLIKAAIAAEADVYITADIKYHEFFDADAKILLMDIGHWESEQFTIDLLTNFLQEKIPTFAVLKTEINTNPVHHFV